jgi:hypothetical protein
VAGPGSGIAGVFAVVAGGAVTAWVMREPRSRDGKELSAGGVLSEEGEGESRSGSLRTASRIFVRRTGKAIARDGGRANTGVRAAAPLSGIDVRQTGDADADGPGSEANSGLDLT